MYIDKISISISFQAWAFNLPGRIATFIQYYLTLPAVGWLGLFAPQDGCCRYLLALAQPPTHELIEIELISSSELYLGVEDGLLSFGPMMSSSSKKILLALTALVYTDFLQHANNTIKYTTPV